MSAAVPSSERRVLLGVTGGIAVYKAVELVRLLVQENFAVRVVLTESAKRFVMPLTFAAVSGAPILDEDDAWQAKSGWVEHIEAARSADVMVIAPATMNTIAKLAHGIADNLLTTTYLAFRGPVIVAPSANWAMYEHATSQANLRILAQQGVEVLPTGQGALACGETGSGRMAEPAAILAAVRRAIARAAHGPLAGRKVVVTAGGTREPIDAVRYIGNRSSGRMGRAVADEAYLRGAQVCLIATNGAAASAADAPYRTVVVETADQMAAAVTQEIDDAAVLVMAAAVADFRPKDASPSAKIERATSAGLTLELVPTPDILASTRRAGLLRVGFAAEAGPRLDRARAKRSAKGVDILVFNDILQAGVGIGAQENEITIISEGEEVHVPRTSKARCAQAILNHVERLLPEQAD